MKRENGAKVSIIGMLGLLVALGGFAPQARAYPDDFRAIQARLDSGLPMPNLLPVIHRAWDRLLSALGTERGAEVKAKNGDLAHPRSSRYSEQKGDAARAPAASNDDPGSHPPLGEITRGGSFAE